MEQNFETLWNSPAIEFLTQSFESGFSSDDILRAIGLFCTNAVSMVDRNGRWIFPTFSFLSHSCLSNCRFFIHAGEQVVVRAQTDISEGSEVTISYTDPFPGNIVRRENIKDLWYFECSCPRCLDTTELGTYISAVRCRLCNGKGTEAYLLPSASDNLTADWQCSKCDNVISNNTIGVLIKGLRTKIKDQCTDMIEIAKLIEDLKEFLHPNNFLILDLKQKWVNNAGKQQKYDRKMLETTINYISDILKINKIIDPGLTLTLGENLKLLNKAMLNLGKIKMESNEISKKEFMSIALGAAANIKFAKQCFENV